MKIRDAISVIKTLAFETGGSDNIDAVKAIEKFYDKIQKNRKIKYDLNRRIDEFLNNKLPK